MGVEKYLASVLTELLIYTDVIVKSGAFHVQSGALDVKSTGELLHSSQLQMTAIYYMPPTLLVFT